MQVYAKQGPPNTGGAEKWRQIASVRDRVLPTATNSSQKKKSEEEEHKLVARSCFLNEPAVPIFTKPKPIHFLTTTATEAVIFQITIVVVVILLRLATIVVVVALLR